MDHIGQQLEKFLGGWLRSVSNTVTHAFTQKLEGHGVTVAEWAVLRVMYECESTMSPSEAAQRTGLTRGAVTKLIDKAIEEGLVIRSESKADRRYQEIKLTRKGKALVPKLTAIAVENDDQHFSCLTVSQRSTLVRLLKKVAEANQITGVPIK